MEYPRVSIVTPSLNQGKYIRETIESVLRQDYPDIEYLVQDGGSTDNTLDILRSYGSRILWQSQPDKGQADAINNGMARSSGLILTWLNSDDTLLPGAVSTIVDRFRRYPEAGLFYGNAIFTGSDGGFLFTTEVAHCDFELMFETCRNPICQPASFFTKEAWEKVGGLDTNLHYFFDWDLWLRLGYEFPLYATSAVLATYRLHPESKTVRGAYPAGELAAIYDKLGKRKLGNRNKALYQRMAEYQSASGQPFQAWLSRRRAWLSAR